VPMIGLDVSTATRSVPEGASDGQRAKPCDFLHEPSSRTLCHTL
jgi:hypothetical protein